MEYRYAPTRYIYRNGPTNPFFLVRLSAERYSNLKWYLIVYGIIVYLSL